MSSNEPCSDGVAAEMCHYKEQISELKTKNDALAKKLTELELETKQALAKISIIHAVIASVGTVIVSVAMNSLFKK